MISEHAEVFFQRPVKPFEGPADWEGPDQAYRVAITWDDPPKTLMEQLKELLAQPGAEKLAALVIGAWTGDQPSTTSEAIVQLLVKQKDRMRGLRAIFFGDITSEENEISWIEQSDMSPLLAAYPRLEVLRVRGGNGLGFGKLRHEALRELIVESGGLRRSTVREIFRCDFPSLEHLELWLGVDAYGWDGAVEDLQPVLAGMLFPKLKYLGLRNSEIVDDIAAVIVNAPILSRLEVLDLSNGTMTDVGGRALLNLPADLPLRELILSHHYMTPALIKELKKRLPYRVNADDGQDPGAEWRSVVVSE